MVGESPVARLYIVVRAERGHLVPDVDAATLEAQVAAAVRSWDDDLAEEAVRQLGEERAAALLAMCSGEQIPQTYKTDVPAAAAVDDLEKILELRESGESISFDLWESEGYVGGTPVADTPGHGGGGGGGRVGGGRRARAGGGAPPRGGAPRRRPRAPPPPAPVMAHAAA